jgi:tetratricopeptide (TPR) repeat protein
VTGGITVIDEEELRRSIEGHLENAEEYIRDGKRHRAFIEFENAAAKLEAAGKKDQLEQLWSHAATGFTAAEAPLQAGKSYSLLADLEAKADRQADARDSYLAAANAYFAVRDKNQELWTAITQTVDRAIDLSIALDDPSLAIELLYKNATIHYRETGYRFDAINCLERAQDLLAKVPNHSLASEIKERLQELVDYQS